MLHMRNHQIRLLCKPTVAIENGSFRMHFFHRKNDVIVKSLKKHKILMRIR